MKTNGLSLLGALCFSLLFYKQDMGFNVLLFAILAILLLLVLRPVTFKYRQNLWAGLGYLGSAIFVFMTATPLAMVTHGIAFLAVSRSPETAFLSGQ